MPYSAAHHLKQASKLGGRSRHRDSRRTRTCGVFVYGPAAAGRAQFRRSPILLHKVPVIISCKAIQRTEFGAQNPNAPRREPRSSLFSRDNRKRIRLRRLPQPASLCIYVHLRIVARGAETPAQRPLVGATGSVRNSGGAPLVCLGHVRGFSPAHLGESGFISRTRDRFAGIARSNTSHARSAAEGVISQMRKTQPINTR
jgi:hypothetical protein